jgi:tetratricopeptide (TPR) repeat protein
MTVLVERANAYPTEANLRSSALIYLQSLPPAATRPEEVYQRGLSIDALRLMRAANAMNDRRFYVELVSNLAEDALPNEVLAVIAEGEAANLVPATGDAFFAERKQTARDNLAEDRASLAGAERRAIADPAARLSTRVADAYYAYENWAKAEELYTAALGKAEADAGLINLRIGQTRYRAGNFAGALEAFARVTEGDRATLARLWEAHTRSKLPAETSTAPAAAPAS